MLISTMIFCCFFFFSSRRRHTRWPRDWSSDVCSSDLRRSLHHVCERLPPLGQRLPELDPGARRAHRPGTRGEGAHHGRERSRVLQAAGLSIVDDDLGARLERFVGERLGASVRVIHLERSTEGFSQEPFGFEVEVGRERRGYVAKPEPVAGLLEPYDLEPEERRVGKECGARGAREEERDTAAL